MPIAAKPKHPKVHSSSAPDHLPTTANDASAICPNVQEHSDLVELIEKQIAEQIQLQEHAEDEQAKGDAERKRKHLEREKIRLLEEYFEKSISETLLDGPFGVGRVARIYFITILASRKEDRRIERIKTELEMFKKLTCAIYSSTKLDLREKVNELLSWHMVVMTLQTEYFRLLSLEPGCEAELVTLAKESWGETTEGRKDEDLWGTGIAPFFEVLQGGLPTSITPKDVEKLAEIASFLFREFENGEQACKEVAAKNNRTLCTHLISTMKEYGQDTQKWESRKRECD